jgi:hypothetical protein
MFGEKDICDNYPQLIRGFATNSYRNCRVVEGATPLGSYYKIAICFQFTFNPFGMSISVQSSKWTSSKQFLQISQIFSSKFKDESSKFKVQGLAV